MEDRAQGLIDELNKRLSILPDSLKKKWNTVYNGSNSHTEYLEKVSLAKEEWLNSYDGINWKRKRKKLMEFRNKLIRGRDNI